MSAHTTALERVERAEVEQTRALNDLAVTVRRADSTVDSVLREHARTAANALQYGRRPTPPPTKLKSDPPHGGKD
jgi:hypothetical protein